jgi:hypothetical protein
MNTGPELRHRHSRPSILRVHLLRVTSCRNTAFTSRPKADHISARLIVRRVRRLNPKSVPQGHGELFSAYRGLSMPARLHRLRTLLYHPQILPRWIETEAQLIPRRLQRGLPQMVSDCRLWTHADQLAHKYDLADRGRRSRAWQPPVTTNITSISTKSPNGGSNWFITCVNQPEDFSAIPDTARSATWTPCCKSTPCSSVASNLGSISSRLWNHSINESSHASSECPAENTTRHLPTGPAGR